MTPTSMGHDLTARDREQSSDAESVAPSPPDVYFDRMERQRPAAERMRAKRAANALREGREEK